MPAIDWRLGIDVGGTNTDAVVMDTADRLIATTKVPTTADITGGITAAIAAVLAAPGVEPDRISHVMLGTTHATNAVLERKSLRRIAVIRIGGPATHSMPLCPGGSTSSLSRSTTHTATPGSGLPTVPGRLSEGGLADTTGEHSVMP